MPHPPTPIERRRRLGNPSKRPMPSIAETGAIAPAYQGEAIAPDPLRPLGEIGLGWWNRVITAGAAWIAPTDLELVQQVAQQIDEQHDLRAYVTKHVNRHPKGLWRERNQLRHLDEAVKRGLNDLGFTPLARTRLGLAQVSAALGVEDARDRMRQHHGSIFDDDDVIDVAPAKPDIDPKLLPRKSWRKPKILAWYEQHSIEVDPAMTRKQLLEQAGVAA